MASALLVQENTATGGVTRIAGHLAAGLTAQGWQTATVNLQGKTWPQGLKTLRTWLQSHQVLVATNNFLPAYVTWLWASLTRTPWVMWVHGPVLPVLAMAQASPLKQRFLRWLYQRAPWVVFGSHAAQSSFEQFTWPTGHRPSRRHSTRQRQQQLTVIHNATTLCAAGSPPESPTEATDDATHIGFVGRLSAEKQPLQLLQLLDQLPTHFVLHVVGDGPLMRAMQQQGQAHIATKRLQLHGQQTVTPRTYAAWQATVLCSAYEGYPMTALESLACGIPCVSTPIPAMQEMLTAYAPYMLATANTPAALAQALLDTLQTSASQRQHDMAAITQAHSPEKFAHAWSQLLHQAIAPRRPSTHTPGRPS